MRRECWTITCFSTWTRRVSAGFWLPKFSAHGTFTPSPRICRSISSSFFLPWLRSWVRQARRITRPLTLFWTGWRTIAASTACRASRSTGARGRRLALPLAPAQALAALDRLFEKSGPAQAVAMSVDWTQLARSFNGQQPPALISDLIESKARPAAAKVTRESGPRLSMQELLAAAPPQRYALLLAHVQ